MSSSSSPAPSFRSPVVYWHQSASSIHLRVQVPGIEAHNTTDDDIQLNLNDRDVTITAKSTETVTETEAVKAYQTTLRLYAPVNDKHLLQRKPNQLIITLTKTSEEEWPRLQETTVKSHFVKFDFDNASFEDDDDENEKQNSASSSSSSSSSSLSSSSSPYKKNINPSFDEPQDWDMPAPLPPSAIYLLTYNSFFALSWFMVIILCLVEAYLSYASSSSPSSSKSRSALANIFSIVALLQAAEITEVIHAFIKLVPGSWVPPLLLYIGRNVILFGLLSPYSELRYLPQSHALFLLWSLGDCIRFTTYTLTVLASHPPLSSSSSSSSPSFLISALSFMKPFRSLTSLLLFPVGCCAELSIALSEVTVSELDVYGDETTKVAAAVYAVLAYVVGAPYLFFVMVTAFRSGSTSGSKKKLKSAKPAKTKKDK